MAELMSLCDDMRMAHLNAQLAKEVPVLWESGKEAMSGGRWRYQGYTPNFTRVEVLSQHDLAGQLMNTRLDAITDDGKRIVGSVSEHLLTKLHPPIALKTL